MLWQRDAMNWVTPSGSRLKIWFPEPKPDDLPKMIGWCSTQCSGLPEVEQRGQIYPNAMVHTSQFTAVFANGGMMEHFCGFFKLWMQMPITRISQSTAHQSKRIRKVRVQKKGAKFRKQSVYRNKPWWKNNKNPRHSWWFGESGSFYAYWWSSSRFGCCHSNANRSIDIRKQCSRR